MGDCHLDLASNDAHIPAQPPTVPACLAFYLQGKSHEIIIKVTPSYLELSDPTQNLSVYVRPVVCCLGVTVTALAFETGFDVVVTLDDVSWSFEPNRHMISRKFHNLVTIAD